MGSAAPVKHHLEMNNRTVPLPPPTIDRPIPLRELLVDAERMRSGGVTAERERCAALAEDEARAHGSDSREGVALLALAERIRGGR